MPIKIVKPDHIEIVGKGFVLLTAPHAAGPKADLHTGKIVEDTALLAKCTAVIGKISGNYVDLNRIQAAQTDFRLTIQDLIREHGIRCILHIHGKIGPGVTIGMLDYKSTRQDTLDVIREILSGHFQLTKDGKHSGIIEPGSITETYSPDKATEGAEAQVVQLEFGENERNLQSEEIVRSITNIVTVLNQRFENLSVHSRNQGSGNSLDHDNPGTREDSNEED